MSPYWLVVAAALAVAAPASMAARVESLGAPCRAKQVLAGRIVTDRNTGADRFAITTSNEETNLSLIFIDAATGAAKVYRAPAGQGSWALLEIPGDRLVVGTYYDGKYMVFDLRRMRFTQVSSFPGEQYVWNLAIGSDGRVYGGTYPGAKLGAFDLKTGTVEDCGAPAPPNLYLRQVSATADGRILCSFGMAKPAVLLYDPATKRFSPLPKTLEGASVCTAWNGYTIAGARVFQGPDFTQVERLPFPAPPADLGDWYASTQMTTADRLVLQQGTHVYTYRAGDTALHEVANADLRGGILYAVGSDGTAYGVRGQDWFALRAGQTKPDLKPIGGDGGPRPILWLREDASGRIWGGPHFGQTLFYVDPNTGKSVNTSAISDSGGEVYDAAFRDGVVYAAAYAGGEIIRYDPSKPWDEWDHVNPRTLVALDNRGYIRPVGGILFGPDGKLYSGWMARYGTYGGGVAITDSATGRTDLIENPLGEQAIEGLAVDGSFAYVGTSLSANGLPEKKGESARFGIIDLAARKVVMQHEFTGASSVRSFALDRATGRLAINVDGALWVFDTASRKFVDLPVDTPPTTGYLACAPGDGHLYYALNKSVIALDLKSLTWRRLADLDANISNVATLATGPLFVTCGAKLYRVAVERGGAR